MSHPVIRFPPPPPTINNLTVEQRAQLMRTNNKLGEVLGSTPHVIDFPYPPKPALRVDIPARVSEHHPRRKFMKGHRHSNSLPQVDEVSAREGSSSRTSSRPSTSSSTRSSVDSHTSSRSINSEQSWRSPYHPMQRPPLLKLFPAEPTLDDFPVSPSPDEQEYSVPDSPSEPVFSIPSENAMRRKKMRRLTRKLGEGVPVDLVFPPKVDTDSDSDEQTPLLETPASDRKLPFSIALPTIREATSSIDSHRGASERSERTSSFVKDSAKTPKHRDAVYVIDSPDEHGLGDTFEGLCIGVPPPTTKAKGKHSERSAKTNKKEPMVCLGVSASAGQSGKGHSRRWVQGDVPFDQVAGSWGGRLW